MSELFPALTLDSKEHAYLWSALEIVPGKARGNDSTICAYAVVLDKDSADIGDMQATCDRLRAQGYAFAVYTSYSHMNPSKAYPGNAAPIVNGPFDCFRIILPVSRPIILTEYRSVVKAVTTYVVPDPMHYVEEARGTAFAPRGWDAAAEKIAQPWYEPCCPPELADHAEFDVYEGKVLDVEGMLSYGFPLTVHEPRSAVPASAEAKQQLHKVRAAFEAAGCGFHGNRATCPVCRDVSASVTADVSGEQILLNAFCACRADKEGILKAVGLTWLDLSTDAYKEQKARRNFRLSTLLDELEGGKSLVDLTPAELRRALVPQLPAPRDPVELRKRFIK